MNCHFKRGDELKCVNNSMSEYGSSAYVDRIGDRDENGWEVVFFGGTRRGIVDGRVYNTNDFTKVGKHPRIR